MELPWVSAGRTSQGRRVVRKPAEASVADEVRYRRPTLGGEFIFQSLRKRRQQSRDGRTGLVCLNAELVGELLDHSVIAAR